MGDPEQLCKLLEKASLLLISLKFSRSSISDRDLAGFTMQLENLESLNLRRCRGITDKGLLKIIGPNLKSLITSNTRITGDGLADGIVQLNNIESLDLMDCEQLTDTGLRGILSVCGPNLKSLHLRRTKITGESMVGFTKQLNNLENLNLTSCEQLTDPGLRGILSVCGPNLKSLNLSGTKITGESMVEFTKQFNNLKTLCLMDCEQITVSGLRELLRIFGQNLEWLVISGTKVTGTVLVNRIEQQPLVQWRRLFLGRCVNVTPSDRLRIAELLPNCDINYY